MLLVITGFVVQVLLLFRILLNRPREVLFLTASGVKDLRVARKEVPWTAILEIMDIAAPPSTPLIVLELDPPFLTTLRPTWPGELGRRLSRIVGPNRFCIRHRDLMNVSREELLVTLHRFHDAAITPQRTAPTP